MDTAIVSLPSAHIFQPDQTPLEYPSLLTPQAEGRYVPDRGGRAVFVVAPIKAGDVVAVFGGRVVGIDEALALEPSERSRVLQVAERWFLQSTQECPSDWINHSCDPNCGFRDEVTLVALRDLHPGEEITFDYAMADSVSYDEFPCVCGTSLCRGAVKATDWRLPVLRDRYGDRFSPYLRRMCHESLGQDF